jgi:hypothetical protein
MKIHPAHSERREESRISNDLRSFTSFRMTETVVLKWLIVLIELGQMVFFGQFFPFLVRQGFHVGFPARTPVGMPAPQPAQQRFGVLVIPASEQTFLTIGFRHGGCSLASNLQQKRFFVLLNEPS